MRNLERLVRGLDEAHLAADPAQAVVRAVLQAAVREHLHADADAKERPPAFQHRFPQRLDHSGRALKPPVAIAESSDARQHDAVRAPDRARIGGNGNFRSDPALPGRALESLRGGMQIA